MNFIVFGAGYVGLSLAILIATKHHVVLVDKDKKKIDQLKKNISPIKDSEIETYLTNKKLNLDFSTKSNLYLDSVDYIVIATPTNYLEDNKSFNTSSVEEVISDAINSKTKADIIIKSTIPIGFTNMLRNKYSRENIYFSPEFLRETKALHDNLYPSRIIVGHNTNKAKLFGNILAECSLKKIEQNQIITMSSKEAESVKLFANTYLAMRVSFFNELDSFSEVNGLYTKNMIKGISSDPRIGDFYNNPSFGYGGYCLPKDTKQLLNDFDDVPSKLINSVIESNATRKKFIVDQILKKKPQKVGVYRLIMKSESDNFRESAIVDIIKILQKKEIAVVLYEPLINSPFFDGIEVLNNLNQFINCSDLIIANRSSNELKNISDKVYTRDIFGNN